MNAEIPRLGLLGGIEEQHAFAIAFTLEIERKIKRKNLRLKGGQTGLGALCVVDNDVGRDGLVASSGVGTLADA